LSINFSLSLSLSLGLGPVVCCRKTCGGIVLAAICWARAPRGGVTRKRRCAYRPSVIYLIVINFSLSLSLYHISCRQPKKKQMCQTTVSLTELVCMRQPVGQVKSVARYPQVQEHCLCKYSYASTSLACHLALPSAVSARNRSSSLSLSLYHISCRQPKKNRCARQRSLSLNLYACDSQSVK